jgi:hypothetical protein
MTINGFFQHPRYFIFILIQEYVDISISFRRRYFVLFHSSFHRRTM